MITKSNNMNNGEMSPEEVALQIDRDKRLNEIKKNRQEGLAKARAAKAAKAKLRLENGEKPTPVEQSKNIWMDIFLTLMRTRDTKTSKDAIALIDVSDEIFVALDEAGKI